MGSSLFMCLVHRRQIVERFRTREGERGGGSAHGQWETGAPSAKTGAGDYFKLIVKVLRRSSQDILSFFGGGLSPLV